MNQNVPSLIQMRPGGYCPHVIQRTLNPRFLSYTASYDVASDVRPALTSSSAL
jgi:hypothetical protein